MTWEQHVRNTIADEGACRAAKCHGFDKEQRDDVEARKYKCAIVQIMLLAIWTARVQADTERIDSSITMRQEEEAIQKKRENENEEDL